MQLYMKQKIFSIRQAFDICDAEGNRVYQCKGEIFSLRRKLHILDAVGNEVAMIRQKLFRIMPTFEIIVGGERAATIVKKFKLFRHDFRYDGLDWEIVGDFWAHDYTILNGDEMVTRIAKKWLSWGDTYHIDINEKYNPLICLASVLAIDCACHEGN